MHSLLCGRETLGKPQARQKYRKGVGFNEQQKGVGRSLAWRIWHAGGTPKTHLVPPFCDAGALAVATKHFLSRPDNLTRERQMTSLCGVSPILHRIKNREPEEHTGAVSGFAMPVQGIVLSGEPQATERPSVPSPPTDDLRSGGNAPPSVPQAPDHPLKGDEPGE